MGICMSSTNSAVQNVYTTAPPTAASAPPATSTTTQAPSASAAAPRGSQNAGRGAFARALANDPAAMAAAAVAYRQHIHYHGTSEGSKTSLQSDGFDVNQKAGGATQTVANHFAPNDPFIADAAGHNFIAADKLTSMSYAKTGAPHDPALVRVVVERNSLGLEDDPDSSPTARALRTRQPIPSGHVLQSKSRGDHSRSGDAAAIFQQALRGQGVHANLDESQELLTGAQSDSDGDDYTNVPIMGV
jgi:hypothetical protein